MSEVQTGGMRGNRLSQAVHQAFHVGPIEGLRPFEIGDTEFWLQPEHLGNLARGLF